MSENKFFVCENCGNIVEVIQGTGAPAPFKVIEPGTVEASHEKHIPVVTVEGNKVKVVVGEVEHPMIEEHSILWVYLETDKGSQRKELAVGSAPVVTFALEDEKPLAVYAYCNLHGLWKTEIKEEPVCDLKPVDSKAKENYIVCKCNSVSYFDILDAVHNHGNLDNLLDVFEDVKNTTHCSTGCGGCYEKVISIISDVLAHNTK